MFDYTCMNNQCLHTYNIYIYTQLSLSLCMYVCVCMYRQLGRSDRQIDRQADRKNEYLAAHGIRQKAKILRAEPLNPKS